MTHPSSLSRALPASPTGRPWQTLMAEAAALLQAISSPGPLLEQGEQMRKLYRQADRLDATDPFRAALLRRRATRIGL
jgi:hypothetical protein